MGPQFDAVAAAAAPFDEFGITGMQAPAAPSVEGYTALDGDLIPIAELGAVGGAVGGHVQDPSTQAVNSRAGIPLAAIGSLKAGKKDRKTRQKALNPVGVAIPQWSKFIEGKDLLKWMFEPHPS